MILEVRELLEKIDLLVDAEERRLTDKIDELKEELAQQRFNQNQSNKMENTITNLRQQLISLKQKCTNYEKKIDDYSNMANQITKISQKNEDLGKKIQEYKFQLEEFEKIQQEYNALVESHDKLKQEQAGYKFTIKVISDWIPSQKENISVLVALSSAPEHRLSYNDLNERTTIPQVTLKNRIIPLLEEKSLVDVKKPFIILSIAES